VGKRGTYFFFRKKNRKESNQKKAWQLWKNDDGSAKPGRQGPVGAPGPVYRGKKDKGRRKRSKERKKQKMGSNFGDDHSNFHVRKSLWVRTWEEWKFRQGEWSQGHLQNRGEKPIKKHTKKKRGGGADVLSWWGEKGGNVELARGPKGGGGVGSGTGVGRTVQDARNCRRNWKGGSGGGVDGG